MVCLSISQAISFVPNINMKTSRGFLPCFRDPQLLLEFCFTRNGVPKLNPGYARHCSEERKSDHVIENLASFFVISLVTNSTILQLPPLENFALFYMSVNWKRQNIWSPTGVKMLHFSCFSWAFSVHVL